MFNNIANYTGPAKKLGGDVATKSSIDMEVTSRINRDERRNSLPYARSVKPEEVRIRNKAYNQLRKQINLETRADRYCSYRSANYTPSLRQVQLCGAKSSPAIGSSFAVKTSGRIPERDVEDYLKRTRIGYGIV